MKKLFASLLLVVILIQPAGCGSPTPALTLATLPTNTPVPVPTDTPIPVPTDTPVPTPTTEPNQAILLTPAEEIDQLLTGMNTKKIFNGIALLAKDGKILLHKAYGITDPNAKVPLEKDALMPLLTFHLEAAAILLLELQGKLSLDDPICDYLPDCPENWNPLTINNILYHSWGMPHDAIYGNINSQVDWWEFWLSPTRYEQIIEKTGGKPFKQIDPPANAFWSWMNYALQDELIEQITGESPDKYIVKNILEPLGITRLGKNYSKEDVAAGLLAYSTSRSREPYPANALFPYFPISTAEDLYILSQEFLDPKVLPIEVVHGLRIAYDYSPGYGIDSQDLIGFRNFQQWKSFPGINGKGSLNWWSYSMGYSGAQFISFEDHIVIILLTNLASQDYASLLQTIYETMTAD